MLAYRPRIGLKSAHFQITTRLPDVSVADNWTLQKDTFFTAKRSLSVLPFSYLLFLHCTCWCC